MKMRAMPRVRLVHVALFCIEFEVLQVDIDTVDGAVVQASGSGSGKAQMP